MEEVENDITKTSWIGSCQSGTFTLLGFGLSLCGNVVGVVPGHYFEKRRPAAYGVCMAGGALGLFIAGPLTRYLLDQYNLHGTLLIMGAISFHMSIAASLLRKPSIPSNESFIVVHKDEDDVSAKEASIQDSDEMFPRSDTTVAGTNPTKDTNTDQTTIPFLLEDITPRTQTNEEPKTQCCNIRLMLNIMTKRDFLMYNFTILFWSLGDAACIFHLPNYAEIKGSSPRQAASLFSAMGAGGIFTRVVIGLMASSPSTEYTLLQFGIVGVTGLITIFFPLFSSTYHCQIAFALLYGLYSHGTNSLMGPLTIQLTSLSDVAIGFGIVYFSCGIGYLLGPVIASFIYDVTQVYDYTFVFGGACFLLSSMSTAGISLFQTTVIPDRTLSI
ncbi:monocarboxylate transporter 12-like isoform X1 [Haliotis rubra]|uniref:monocarboxylate transporter 12-like isoform X1 n=1 Tax=Haliotis rubra TaxID=36100 RepID=UPI001EE53095|nr:monocarboxylate transporter 12-like isoform X1 [Haliotis rubra]